MLPGCKISWRIQLGSCDIPHAIPTPQIHSNTPIFQYHKYTVSTSRELCFCLQRSFPGQTGLVTFAADVALVPSWSNDPWPSAARRLRKSGLSWIVAPQQANLFRGKVHQKRESCFGCWVGFFFFPTFMRDLWEKKLLLMSSALLCPSEGALRVGLSHSRI